MKIDISQSPYKLIGIEVNAGNTRRMLIRDNDGTRFEGMSKSLLSSATTVRSYLDYL